ncbi:MAG: hypothetical protein ACJ8C4_06590 [Gemmataceae bacterium]
MSATKTKRATPTPRQAERKYGPFHGGVGVAVWLNEVKTEDGVRYYRSITIAPRRFRNKDGDWQDAGSLRGTDIPSLVLALEAAHEFIRTTPLPGESAEDEVPDNPPVSGKGEVPF